MTENEADDAPDAGNGATDESVADPPPAAEPSPLAAMTAERDKVRDQLLRTAADFENFRKRARRDVDEAERRGREDAIREVLPVIDNLERAVAASAGAADVKVVADGVRMVLRMFDDAARAVGLSRVRAIGERFDPGQHDALSQVETTEHAPGTIIAEIEAGYRLGDRLVRAAKVVVARQPAPSVPGPATEPAPPPDEAVPDPPTPEGES